MKDVRAAFFRLHNLFGTHGLLLKLLTACIDPAARLDKLVELEVEL